MRRILLILLLGVLLCIYSCLHIKKTENSDIVYKAEISSSCVTTDVGAIMIYDYCNLNFKNEHVKVRFYQESNMQDLELGEDKWEIYSYCVNMDTLKINGFKYSTLLMEKYTLIYDNDKIKIKFVKQ